MDLARYGPPPMAPIHKSFWGAFFQKGAFLLFDACCCGAAGRRGIVGYGSAGLGGGAFWAFEEGIHSDVLFGDAGVEAGYDAVDVLEPAPSPPRYTKPPALA